MNYLEYLKDKDKNEEFECFGGVSQNLIKDIEDKLKVAFPQNYKEYLNQCGTIGFGDSYIFGLFTDFDNEVETGNVFMETKKYRLEIELPNDYIVLEADEDENIILLKISDTNDCGVYSVDILEKENLTYIKQFDGFEDYFKNFIISLID